MKNEYERSKLMYYFIVIITVLSIGINSIPLSGYVFDESRGTSLRLLTGSITIFIIIIFLGFLYFFIGGNVKWTKIFCLISYGLMSIASIGLFILKRKSSSLLGLIIPLIIINYVFKSTKK